MHYTEKDVELLLQEVEQNFSAYLAKAEESEKEEKEKEKKDEPKDEAPHKEEESKEAPKEEKPESKEMAEPEKEEAKPEHDDEACDYDDEDHAHMQKMYMSMKKGELKAHHDAVKMALDKCGMDKCGGMEMSEMKKTEVSFEIDTKKFTQEIALLKSEISQEKAKNEKLTQEMVQVEKFVEKLLEKKPAPAAKAFTSLDVIQKSEAIKEEKSLSKSEINQILAQKAQDPSLSKSDRELINQYCLSGGSTKIISHLLK